METYINDLNIEVSSNYSLKTITKYNYNESEEDLLPYNLETGILFLDEELKAFSGGFLFKDKYNNLYDTAKKKIYFNDGIQFIGDFDKPAFSLFEGFDEFEMKFKNYIKKIEKDNKSEEDKKKLKNEIFKELKAKLEKFDMNNIILKNGKYIYSNIKYVYIHDNILEYYYNNEKYKEYHNFLQEIDNEYHYVYLIFYGNYIDFKDNYEGEEFYRAKIGKGKVQGDINNKFYFLLKETNINKILKKIKEEDEYFFAVFDKRITAVLVKAIESDSLKAVFIKPLP